jgi:hypothetical protein
MSISHGEGAPTERADPEPFDGKLTVVIDHQAAPGNMLPALARYLRRLRGRDRQQAGPGPGPAA